MNTINQKNTDTENFRGVKKCIMVKVLEGNGKDVPYREVYYIYDLENHAGTHGGYLGKIDIAASLDYSGDSIASKVV